MPDKPSKKAALHWQAGPIIDWLLEDGRMLADVNDVVRQLGQRMLASGAPLWRLRLSMRTLHPLMTAITAVWERDSGPTANIETPHGLEGRAGYVGSPLEIIARTGAPYRKQLTDALPDTDHAVLHDLRARGGTDYFGLPMKFSEGAAAILVFTSDGADGFSDVDIEQFTAISSILAPVAEVFSSKRVSLAVAEAYLGARTGQRVLDGQITRGHIEKIDAAILVSDIRDWTGLNNRLAAETTLALANRYFEVIAEAVDSNGGEILKFIGDGVLAVFATDNDISDAETVCERALAAARQALRMAQEADPPLGLRFGMGMHFGQVLYGNVGSNSRIDFTVLGQAVNIAARIEGLCGKLEKSLLFSQDFADRLGESATRVAEEHLKGHDTRSAIFTAAQEPSPAG